MRKKTIYEALRDKLGREPTHNELVDDVKRILVEAREERGRNDPLNRMRAHINQRIESGEKPIVGIPAKAGEGR